MVCSNCLQLSRVIGSMCGCGMPHSTALSLLFATELSKCWSSRQAGSNRCMRPECLQLHGVRRPSQGLWHYCGQYRQRLCCFLKLREAAEDSNEGLTACSFFGGELVGCFVLCLHGRASCLLLSCDLGVQKSEGAS